MKKLIKAGLFFLILAILFVFIFRAYSAYAESVSLKWDANTESDLAGYNIYVSIRSRDYTNDDTKTYDVGNVTTYTVTDLIVGTTYYFAATAYDTSGNESDHSNELIYLAVDITPPDMPRNMRLIIITQ